MKKLNFNSRKGFTLIELLVVIGILAVLAAIAIPSVAGLIDRANVSADKTNANEMANAVERFVSEYELYKQDIASGTLDTSDLDGAQGRVYNVTGITTRDQVTKFESTGFEGKGINIDTKYPANEDTLKAVIQNYTKTSSSTFEPKQSDCQFYYSPEVGGVIVGETGATISELNEIYFSGSDDATADGNINWICLDDTVDNAATDTRGVHQKITSSIAKDYEIVVPSKIKIEHNGKTYNSGSRLTINGNDKIKIIGSGWYKMLQLENGTFEFSVRVSSEKIDCKAECGMSWQTWLDSDLCTLNSSQKTYLTKYINGNKLPSSGGNFYYNSNGTSKVGDISDKIEIYGEYKIGIQFPTIPG